MSTGNGASSVAELLLHYLKIEEVKYLFGVPGGALANILWTLRQPQHRDFFTYIVCRQETGAAYIAQGYFRATGHPGVVLVTSGPGATNALTGTLNAEFGGLAVITITGEVKEQDLGRGYLQDGIEIGLDVGDIYDAATNYSATLTDATSAKTLIQQALRDAMSKPRHAVHLSIPDDIAGEKLPDIAWVTELPSAPHDYRAVPSGVPDLNHVKAVADLLATAKRPLIFVGNGCREPLRHHVTASALAGLVKTYAIPVMTTMDGKGLFPERHDFSLRVYGYANCSWPYHWLRPANSEPYDALLVLGSSLGELSTNKWNPILEPKPNGAFIQVDINQHIIGRAFNVTHGIVADAGEFIRALSECLLSRQPSEVDVAMREFAINEIKRKSPFVQREDYTNGDYWSDYESINDAEGIEPAALIRVLQDFLDGNESMIFVDAGNCVGWGAHYFVVDPPTEYHSTLSMGPMGFGVASVIGAKLGRNQKGKKDCVCLALVGDGAFMMHGVEISTASTHKIGAVWIVLQDNDLRMVTQGMRQWEESHPQETPIVDFEGCYRLGTPDLVKFADALGAQAMLAENYEQLRGAVEKALEGARKDQPQVVVVRINPKRMPPYMLGHYFPKPQTVHNERALLARYKD
jgi:acetolactate synthase-1/2/3 large subunit